MHEHLMAFDGHAVKVCHALMPKAHPQNRDFACEKLDDLAGDPGIFGCTWARGDDDMAWADAVVEFLGLLWRNGIVANDHEVSPGLELGIDLTKPLNEVPGEGIVVVDQKYHLGELYPPKSC